MIEGTKQYRARSAAPKIPETANPSPNTDGPEGEPAPAAAIAITTDLSTVNAPPSPARREWFRSLVPSLGNGLVEILRASNNLKRDLEDSSRIKE